MILNQPWMDYIVSESIDNCDKSVHRALKDALIDIVGCTIAGSQTPVADSIRKFACTQWGSGRSTVVMGSAKRLAVSGAALVNATMANALDVDDGHRLVKGHPGAVIFPAVLAAAEDREASGKEFLNALLVGYEIGIRAGIIAHEVRPEYHCTGSWGALGAAAGTAKLIGLTGSSLEHALGIAEYQGPYSPMMRCIDVPAMVKDGIGWGCMSGISAAYLAANDFTGIPSLFTMEAAKALVDELGQTYRIKQLYYKPHCCCRWAQPAVEGIRYLLEQHEITPASIEKIVIHTFTESARLQQRPPQNTEEAQYNLFFPSAAYLVFGEVGPQQVLYQLQNDSILQLMGRMEVQIEPQFDQAFPQKALSQVKIFTSAGSCYLTPVMQARGDYDYPLTSEEKTNKFIRLTEPLLGRERSVELLHRLQHIEDMNQISQITALIS